MKRVPATPPLVLFGGINVEGDSVGGWRTKRAFVRYVQDLQRYYPEIVLYAPSERLGTGFSSPLPSKGLLVRAYDTSFARLAALWFSVLRDCSGAAVLVHMPNGVPLAPILPLICRRSAIFAVYLASDFNFWSRLICEQSSWIKGVLYRRAHCGALSWADLVIGRGEYLCRLAQNYTSRVYKTVPLSDVDFSVPVSSPAIGGNLGRNSILYIGKLLWSKGLRELIDAFSLLRMRPGADALVLQIVGHGADAEAIRAYAKEQGLEHCTRFYGWVDESGAVEQLWREALLLIVPSNSSEGVPRVIDEAMYHHVPVVATRVGGIPLEFKAGEVVLVDPGCPSSLADAAHSVLADKELAQRIERATSLRCEGFKAYGTAGAQHGLLLSQHQQRIPTAASSGAASLDGATV